MQPKSLLASKTFWVNVIIAALGISAEISQIFPISQHPKVWITVTTVLNIALRLVTGQPIGTQK